MNVINDLIKSIFARRRNRILNKQLEELKRKLEIKKILNCALISTCPEPNCPILSLIEKNKSVD
jgi:hypothetical protein